MTDAQITLGSGVYHAYSVDKNEYIDRFKHAQQTIHTLPLRQYFYSATAIWFNRLRPHRR